MSLTREDLIDIRESQRFIQERASDKPAKNVTETREMTDIGTSTENKSPSLQMTSRSQAILEVLRVHGELGIRDVASNLPEYSEKMIQRELAELVSHGRVKKTGLKRWSRYTYIEA